MRVFDAGFVFGQEQIQRLAGFPRLAVHHGFELLARDGAFRQIADAQHVVELQRIAVTGFERGIGAGELFGEVGAVDVVVFALVFRRQTGRVDLMQDAEGFAVHAAVENGFGQIDPCTVDPRAVAVALGQGEHSAGVVVGRVDVVVVVLLVDLLRRAIRLRGSFAAASSSRRAAMRRFFVRPYASRRSMIRSSSSNAF